MLGNCSDCACERIQKLNLKYLASRAQVKMIANFLAEAVCLLDVIAALRLSDVPSYAARQNERVQIEPAHASVSPAYCGCYTRHSADVQKQQNILAVDTNLVYMLIDTHRAVGLADANLRSQCCGRVSAVADLQKTHPWARLLTCRCSSGVASRCQVLSHDIREKLDNDSGRGYNALAKVAVWGIT